ncbi:hypothetical protein M422DRAFT_61240 [Sphaerobolus stellatus SS14]|uniref:tRNA-5-taurinomethyluridine 2-sulfurtransferase n=1 Tax=Sphaerobolus stellatus (strain SS14) TaxID=990650 RepID=A0A0C9VDQ0_SPHS4|nr:hypothetical protein M422DRAFT_62137 [Sphaerobolus stellatus SS14]KIJ35725.1 hypothetical protein M422DRAFT_61240 [Sphaerobolus stellatus SS14]
MSGGVDSSVAALLLSQKDYDLSAVFMRNWDTRDETGTDIGCEWEKDWEYVRRVCARLDIPCSMIDLSTQYWTHVFEPALQAWEDGSLTPNPDVWCNREIKFGVLMEKIIPSQGKWLATGHYANVLRNDHGRPILYRASDKQKDQSFFLSSISEESLGKTIFPLGRFQKQEVRELARKSGLPTALREESMGLCFVGEKRRFNDFLSQYLKSKSGKIVDPSGKILSTHDGLWRYTIGQGAKIPGQSERMFVVSKNSTKNQIVVAPGTNHPLLFSKSILVRDWRWIWPDFSIPSGFPARVKIRHHMSDVPCIVDQIDSVGTMRITFIEPEKAIAPGQVAVIWDGEWCLGCGTIAKTYSAADTTS